MLRLAIQAVLKCRSLSCWEARKVHAHGMHTLCTQYAHIFDSRRRDYNHVIYLMHCVAVCCSMLQCVAMCCSVLQCVAVCCSVLQCVVVCCSALQSVAGALQHTAKLCNTYTAHTQRTRLDNKFYLLQKLIRLFISL